MKDATGSSGWPTARPWREGVNLLAAFVLVAACADDVETRLCSIVGYGTGFTSLYGGHILYKNGSEFDTTGESWAFMSRFVHPHPKRPTAEET